jgi:hypothetical protein
VFKKIFFSLVSLVYKLFITRVTHCKEFSFVVVLFGDVEEFLVFCCCFVFDFVQKVLIGAEGVESTGGGASCVLH